MGRLITEEFDLDPSSSHDKADALEPHEFGYRWVEYIVFLKAKRCDLPEWEAFVGMKVEIQVQTVLQHAWAAISHTIDYQQELDDSQSNCGANSFASQHYWSWATSSSP